MHYELEFCFPTHPKIILKAFVSAKDEQGAKSKFEEDYPNLVGCEILSVNVYKSERGK